MPGLQRMTRAKRILFGVVLAGMVVFGGRFAEARTWVSSREYTVSENEDGGYTLNIAIETRYLGFTWDGFFPKQRSTHEIRLVGRGFNRQLYKMDKVHGWGDIGDLRWAYVDLEKKEIYINAYDIRSPDSLVPTTLNGCYKIKGHEARKDAAPAAGATKVVTLPGGEGMEMVWCPAGTFTMGSPKEEEGRDQFGEDQMQVTLSKGFWMAKTEVTQRQWESVMGNNPSWRKGDDLPVDGVSWVAALWFCRKAGMQLPTEAQWEYACRAGSTGAYAGNLDSMAWYVGNSGGTPHPVGQKRPNAWGLHDMHGNVLEWCADWSECRMDTTAVTDPTGPASGTGRVLRGGSWVCDAEHCRSAWSGIMNEPEYSVRTLGFRPVMGGP